MCRIDDEVIVFKGGLLGPPFFVGSEVVFAAIVLVSVPAIRCPRQPL